MENLMVIFIIIYCALLSLMWAFKLLIIRVTVANRSFTHKYAIKARGADKQTDKCIEELSELIRALARDDHENILEEMAHVYVTCGQVRDIKGIDDDTFQRRLQDEYLRLDVKIKEDDLG